MRPDRRITVCLSPADYKLVDKAARRSAYRMRSGQSISRWCRKVLVAAAVAMSDGQTQDLAEQDV